MPQGPPAYVYVPRPNDGMATASMVVGILSLIGISCYGVPSLILGPIAIALGLSARSRINNSGGTLGGSGFATAGWITGLVGTILGAMFLLLFVGFFGFAMWMAITHPQSPSPSPAV